MWRYLFLLTFFITSLSASSFTGSQSSLSTSFLVEVVPSSSTTGIIAVTNTSGSNRTFSSGFSRWIFLTGFSATPTNGPAGITGSTSSLVLNGSNAVAGGTNWEIRLVFSSDVIVAGTRYTFPYVLTIGDKTLIQFYRTVRASFTIGTFTANSFTGDTPPYVIYPYTSTYPYTYSGHFVNNSSQTLPITYAINKTGSVPPYSSITVTDSGNAVAGAGPYDGLFTTVPYTVSPPHDPFVVNSTGGNTWSETVITDVPCLQRTISISLLNATPTPQIVHVVASGNQLSTITIGKYQVWNQSFKICVDVGATYSVQLDSASTAQLQETFSGSLSSTALSTDDFMTLDGQIIVPQSIVNVSPNTDPTNPNQVYEILPGESGLDNPPLVIADKPSDPPPPSSPDYDSLPAMPTPGNSTTTIDASTGNTTTNIYAANQSQFDNSNTTAQTKLLGDINDKLEAPNQNAKDQLADREAAKTANGASLYAAGNAAASAFQPAIDLAYQAAKAQLEATVPNDTFTPAPAPVIPTDSVDLSPLGVNQQLGLSTIPWLEVIATWFRNIFAWFVFTIYVKYVWARITRAIDVVTLAPQAKGNTVAGTGGHFTSAIAAVLISALLISIPSIFFLAFSYSSFDIPTNPMSLLHADLGGEIGRSQRSALTLFYMFVPMAFILVVFASYLYMRFFYIVIVISLCTAMRWTGIP